ncbi:MAG: TetR/AcrR family transcriptional regulator [Rubrivivax sp.]|nr:MAG: TetR/AcrR family transcriptional regulator [Rubrivivax sp.]
MPMNVPPKEVVGPRLEPDARRAHLLTVGTKVFGSKAYDDVQIDQIAQEAGVSRGLLYHYFPSKRAFFAAIIQGGYDEILEVTRPDSKLSPAEQLQAGLRAYLDYVEGHPHMYRAIFRSAASLEQTVQEVVNRNLDLQARRILAVLGGKSARHSLPYLAVRAWLAFLVQAVLDWLDKGAKGDRQKLIDICVGALRGAVGAAH